MYLIIILTIEIIPVLQILENTGYTSIADIED
jgi:hypothetical protein